MSKYLPFFILSLFLVFNVDALQTVNGRIKITIQTTAGCGDTVWYFANHFVRTYELYKDFLDVEFIPWGRATRHENGTLTCQFGVNDCWANRLHRCGLNLLNGNQDAQVHFMTCEFTNPRPGFVAGSYLCAHAVGLNLVDVDYCVANPGDELDYADEIRGNQMTAATNFIPSISFHDNDSPELHAEGWSRLESLVCLALAADPSTGVTDCSVN